MCRYLQRLGCCGSTPKRSPKSCCCWAPFARSVIKNVINYRLVDHIQFDELQTIEHTKCKPLSVAMAVSKNERKILGFKVSSMPATGHLAKISRKKYGLRPDHRAGLTDLFNDLSYFLSPTITISSDECSFYKGVVRCFFQKRL